MIRSKNYALVLAILLSPKLHATDQFEVPDSCIDELTSTGLCVTSNEAPDEPGSVDVVGYVLLFKSDYENLQAARDRYTSFGNWKSRAHWDGHLI